MAAFFVSHHSERFHGNKRGLNVRSGFRYFSTGWWSDGATKFGLATGIDYNVCCLTHSLARFSAPLRRLTSAALSL